MFRPATSHPDGGTRIKSFALLEPPRITLAIAESESQMAWPCSWPQRSRARAKDCSIATTVIPVPPPSLMSEPSEGSSSQHVRVEVINTTVNEVADRSLFLDKAKG